MDHPAGGWVAVGRKSQPLQGASPVGSLTHYSPKTLPANDQTLRRRPLESSLSQSGQVFHYQPILNRAIILCKADRRGPGQPDRRRTPGRRPGRRLLRTQRPHRHGPPDGGRWSADCGGPAPRAMEARRHGGLLHPGRGRRRGAEVVDLVPREGPAPRQKAAAPLPNASESQGQVTSTPPQGGQGPPLVDPTLEHQKWQTLPQTLPLLRSSRPVFPSDSRPDICPWIIIGQCGLRLFR